MPFSVFSQQTPLSLLFFFCNYFKWSLSLFLSSHFTFYGWYLRTSCVATCTGKQTMEGKTSYMCICGIVWWTHWMWMSVVCIIFYVVQFLPFRHNEIKESKKMFFFQLCNGLLLYFSPSFLPYFIPTSSFNPLWFSNLLSTHRYLLTNNNKGFLLEVMVDLTVSANSAAGFNYLFSLLQLIWSVWKPNSARKIKGKIWLMAVVN